MQASAPYIDFFPNQWLIYREYVNRYVSRLTREFKFGYDFHAQIRTAVGKGVSLRNCEIAYPRRRRRYPEMQSRVASERCMHAQVRLAGYLVGYLLSASRNVQLTIIFLSDPDSILWFFPRGRPSATIVAYTTICMWRACSGRECNYRFRALVG